MLKCVLVNSLHIPKRDKSNFPKHNNLTFTTRLRHAETIRLMGMTAAVRLFGTPNRFSMQSVRRANGFACGHPCHFNLSRMSYVRLNVKCLVCVNSLTPKQLIEKQLDQT